MLGREKVQVLRIRESWVKNGLFFNFPVHYTIVTSSPLPISTPPDRESLRARRICSYGIGESYFKWVTVRPTPLRDPVQWMDRGGLFEVPFLPEQRLWVNGSREVTREDRE